MTHASDTDTPPDGADAPADEASTGWFTDANATFGDRVAWARESAGMTQAALAERIGISVRTLNAWETDTSEPRANRIQMLAGLLGVSMPWLLTGEGDDLEPGAATDPGDVDLTHILVELRAMRRRMAEDVGRVAELEVRLRDRIRAGAKASHG